MLDFGDLQQRKFARVGSTFCQELNKPSKICRTHKILPKWHNLAKSGYTPSNSYHTHTPTRTQTSLSFIQFVFLSLSHSCFDHFSSICSVTPKTFFTSFLFHIKDNLSFSLFNLFFLSLLLYSCSLYFCIFTASFIFSLNVHFRSTISY